MRKKHLLILILIILSVLIYSCAHKSYAAYHGKATKGYHKAPRGLKR